MNTKKYKVAITVSEYDENGKYVSQSDVFEQTVEDLNLRGVIAIMNDLVDGGISQD
jgi:hypothetical protein